MRITYRITTDHLYNGWPLPRTGTMADAAAYNPAALAMNDVHGDDAVQVQYEGRALKAYVDGREVILPAELAGVLEAHADGDSASAQPCSFTIEYTEPPTATMVHETGGGENAGGRPGRV